MGNRNRNVDMGCLHFAVAYALATYAMSVFELWSGSVDGSGLYRVLLAPLSFPFMVVIALLLIGNPELPSDPAFIAWMCVIFFGMFVAAAYLVRECLIRPWLSLVVGSSWLIYLIFAAMYITW